MSCHHGGQSHSQSCHSVITLSFSGVEDGIWGPSFWKFNSSLVNDQDYCDLLDENVKE